MEKPIKYKRFKRDLNEERIEEFFDELITGGWEIIYYDEYSACYQGQITVIVVCQKKQSNIL